METQTTNQPRIADYVRPLIARWWLILVAVVGATGGVYAYYAHKPNVYTTSTLVFLQDPGDPVTGLPSPQSTDRSVENQASLLDSRENAAVVARRIGYRGTAEDLLNQVSLTSLTGQDFVRVSAQAGTPQEAAAIANAFAQRFASSLNGAYRARVAGALKLSKTQLAHTAGGVAAGVQTANLLDQINRLELALGVPTNVAQQVDAALPPSSPSSPRPLRNALFAFLLSILGAVGVAYGLERFDRRLKTPDEMEGAYAGPLLAILPHTANPAPMRSGEPALGSDFREPFRVLRTNVQLASLDAPPRTIVVSSATPGEGKSTVVRNLALAFRESGKRVAVVDLDLRHPALPAVFGVPVGPGITDVLRHGAELDDVTLQIGVGLSVFDELLGVDGSGRAAHNGSSGHNGGAAPHPVVTLLRSGARPANPPAVLASERVVEVLDELRARHDVVLIDSAPVLAVTDTVPLLRYADAALFVGRLDVTTRDTARRLMEFLDRVPDVNLLGVVANDLRRLDAGGYGYGYGYGVDDDHPKRGLRRRRAAEPAKQPV